MDLIKLFEESNERFINNNQELFMYRVSERTLCGALMLELYKSLIENGFGDYYVDVEYNRHLGNDLKIFRKDIATSESFKGIYTDLIVHSRGKKTECDNLIALEMKKSNSKKEYKDNDKKRLAALTTMPGVYDFQSQKSNQYVFGYEYGIYYEINFNKGEVFTQYYKEGEEFGGINRYRVPKGKNVFRVSKPDP